MKKSRSGDSIARTPKTFKRLIPLSFLLLVQSLTVIVASGQTKALTSAQTNQAPSAPRLQGAPWTGDFDAMLQQRRFIRVLVVYSKSQYYVINGVQHGSAYEYMKAFEDWVNLKYPQKVKNTKFHVVFMPVSRDQLIPRLAAGRGDLATGTLEITPERSKVVDFTDPIVIGVREV